MENELISENVEKKIVNDLKKIIDSKKSGKISLNDYVNTKSMGACMDFSMIYESSDELQFLIKEESAKGIRIKIEEDQIEVL